MKKTIRVVGCILSYEGKILLLHRSADETDPSLWGIPAGKVEEGEADPQTAVREILEETGIRVDENSLQYLGLLPIEYETVTVNFPIFHVGFPTAPNVVLDPSEHINYRWIAPGEVLKMPDLMKDVDVIIKSYCIDKLGMS